MPNRAQTPLTRRRVLAGAAGIAVLLVGCTTGAPHESPPAARDPLADLMDNHLALATAYAAAIRATPADARLPALADNVARHIVALAGALAVPAPEADELSAAPTATDSAPAEGAPGAGGTAGALVTALRDQETALAAHSRTLALGQKPNRAPLLASIAASHQCAVEVLG